MAGDDFDRFTIKLIWRNFEVIELKFSSNETIAVRFYANDIIWSESFSESVIIMKEEQRILNDNPLIIIKVMKTWIACITQYSRKELTIENWKSFGFSTFITLLS